MMKKQRQGQEREEIKILRDMSLSIQVPRHFSNEKICMVTHTSWKASRVGGLTMSRIEMI